MLHIGHYIHGCLYLLLLLCTTGAMAQTTDPGTALAESTRSLLQKQLALDESMCRLSGQWASWAAEARDKGKPLAEILGLLRQTLENQPGWFPWFEAITVQLYTTPIRTPRLAQMLGTGEEVGCLNIILKRNSQPPAPRKYDAAGNVLAEVPENPPHQSPTYVLWAQFFNQSLALGTWPTQSACDAKRIQAQQQPGLPILVCLPETVNPRGPR